MRHRSGFASVLLAGFVFAASPFAPLFAQQPSPLPSRGTASVPNYVEYEKRLHAAEQVTPLGSELFGDTVSLYTGQTSFSQLDIDIPGNSALPVQLRRSYRISSLVANQTYDPRGGPGNPYGGLSNWDIEVPHMYGVFDHFHKWDNPSGTTTQQPRCSVFFNPQASTIASIDDVFSGIKVSIPGQGEKAVYGLDPAYGPLQYPSDGRAPTWTTTDFDAFDCISSATAHGEGFVMTTRAGITYTFDVYRERTYPAVSAGSVNNARVAVFLLASKVQDRYGNTVTYTYNGNGHPTLIADETEGRSISLAYDPVDASRLLTATVSLGQPVETRTWTYGYEPPIKDKPSRLTSVTLPDGLSQWGFDYTSLNGPDDSLEANYLPPDGSGKECLPSQITGPGGKFAVRMTHPSGARGDFRFKLERQDRQIQDPFMNCVILAGGGRGYAVAPYIDTFRLKSKALWDTDNTSNIWLYDGGNVTQPDGSVISHYFSSNHRATEGSPPHGAAIEGQLLEVWTVKNGVVLRKEVNEYFTGIDAAGPFPGQLFPSRVGTGGAGGDDPSAGSVRPLKSVTITQQGVSFKRTYSNFDILGRPLTVTRESAITGGAPLYSKTETTVYKDNRNTWLLDQIKTVSDTALLTSPVTENSFDAAGNIVSVKQFGRTDRSMTWNADGTLATITNGPNTTTLGPFKRGIPQSVTYANLTSVSAVIDDAGDIRSVTDENGVVSAYSYDSLRRLTSITYPTGDTVSWLPTTIQYERVGTSGVVEGTHWRQTVSNGDARKVIEYDQRLRPLLTSEYDNASVATTQRHVRRRFDFANRETFVAYPSTGTTATEGLRTAYDALGRVTGTEQDSELGLLTTSTVYTTPFTTQFTNARGKTTSTTFQVFDEPTDAAPVQIDSPLNTTTSITRDGFGKPLSMTRSGLHAGNPLSATRRYVYDAHQRLCKTIEPESGSTVMAYDSANLVAWKASGQPLLTNPADCEQTSVGAGQKVSYAYDARERLLTTSYGDGNPNVVRTYTPDGLPATIASDNSRWTLSYNRRRLMTSETLLLGGTSYPTTYTHTPVGHVATMRYPDATTLAYAPNALGEATQVGDYATQITRHPNGALASFHYGNGIVHTTQQNARGLPSRSTDADVLDDVYTYDENSNVAAITDSLTGAFTRTMAYDDRDRLTSATNSAHWGGTQTFEYDPLDNLRRTVTPTRDWTHYYNATTQRLERIAETSSGANRFTYLYDGRGSITNRTSTDAAQTFAVDLADRVRLVGPAFATYRYDGNGRRTTVTKSSTTTEQVYSQAGQLLFQRGPDPQGDIFCDSFESGEPPCNKGSSVRYIYLGRHLIAEDGPGGRKYIHTDGLGSPARTTGASGVASASARSDYKPYGWGGPNQSKPDFTGHVADPETGLIYMQARYYDPFAGRFLAVDPVAANAVSFNRYWYADNNPYKNIDPDGRYVEAGFEALSLALGVKSAHDNFGQGNYGAAAVDAVGVVVDGVLAAVPLAPGVVGLGIQSGRAGAKIADDALVVRGGSSAGANSIEGIEKGTGTHPSGIHGFSAESANGASLCELCSNVPHGQVGVTTAGKIRHEGGEVFVTEGMSPNHVTVSGLAPGDANKLLTPTQENPVPKDQRAKVD